MTTQTSKTPASPEQNSLPAWNLKDLYNGTQDPRIEEDLEKYRRLNLQLAERFKGRLHDASPETFVEALQLCEELSVVGSALGNFAYLNMVTRMKDAEAVGFYQNVSEKLNDYAKPAIFFSLEINQLSQEKMAQLLASPQVAKYAPFLEVTRRFKEYELSEKEEEVFHEKNLTSSAAWVRLYEETSSRLQYHVDGKTYNDAEISKLLLDPDADLRAKAGKEINRVSGENAELFSFVYNMIVKDKSISDLRRGFKSPVAAKNLVNGVDDSAVKALADAVRENYAAIAHRFYKLKAKWLGVEKIQYWDRNAPLPFTRERLYSWDESVEIVLQAYQRFSPRLQQLADGFFKNDWIDVPPRDGKRSGAFAMPLPQKYHPYLMLNFTGRQNDVLTLAHELGHGCHFLLSQTQGELNDNTPLTLAEVASVFGEMITFQSLLEQTQDPKDRLSLIASKVNDMINTAVRQIAFHFFETRVHNERREGELSAQRLCEIWLEEMRRSLGPSVNVDENSANIWSQVVHFFFSPFYVYAYSFADCLVNSLYQVYREKSVPDFEEKYLHLLSETGVKKYDRLLQPFGLDASAPDFWNKGLSLISEYIDELERLDKQLFPSR